MLTNCLVESIEEKILLGARGCGLEDNMARQTIYA
jgi:hypothetical protein